MRPDETYEQCKIPLAKHLARAGWEGYLVTDGASQPPRNHQSDTHFPLHQLLANEQRRGVLLEER